MDQHMLLKKTIALARTGDKEAFENLYILTAQDTYGKVCYSMKNDKQAEELLVDTYVMLYRRVHELPSGEAALEEKIDDQICRTAYKKYGIEIQDLYYEEGYYHLSEERAVALWLRIEQKAGFNSEKKSEEKGSAGTYFYVAMKIILTIIVLFAAGFILYQCLKIFKGTVKTGGDILKEQTQSENTTAEAVSIEEDLLKPGWEQRPEGNLYYVRLDGTLADKALTLGKQILTFSQKGELTFIAVNPAVAEKPELSFDEGIRYEVRGGDIYKKDLNAGGEETAVVRNGHIVQADVRCGYIWYVCKFQVPNSEQIKTTIYRAEMDGSGEKELYTADKTIQTEQFQITSNWIYYISNGMLLRRSLETGSVEVMAENVEYYFAWEDTAYYMKDRALEKVSQGQSYAGLEAGYKIELQDKGLILLDALGEPVEPEENGDKTVEDRIYTIENGAIISVRPAVRESGDTVYYIDAAGADKKIYSKSGAGVQGLIRQEGLSADSLCIAGDWLYYSARTAEYGGEIGSQIYRLNLQTMELEKVGDTFRGFVRNMYYFDNLQQIYGEYIPSLADPEAIHGKIMVLPIGGQAQVVNDKNVRPEASGSDFLEFVMADGRQIYCLYHECSYDAQSGELIKNTGSPLAIEFNGSGL